MAKTADTPANLVERLAALAAEEGKASVFIVAFDDDSIITHPVRINAQLAEDAARAILEDVLENRAQSPDCACCVRAHRRVDLALQALAVDDVAKPRTH